MNRTELTEQQFLFLTAAAHSAMSAPDLQPGFKGPTNVKMITHQVYSDLGWSWSPQARDESMRIVESLAAAGLLRKAWLSDGGWSFYVTNQGLALAVEVNNSQTGK